MTRPLTLILLVVTALISTSCYHAHILTYSDTQVKATAVLPAYLILSKTRGPGYHTDLTVQGKTYKYARGEEPFYIPVPQLDSILFVTGEQTATFHLINLTTRLETRIDGGNSPFGHWIGWHTPENPRPGGSNYVASADSRKLVLVTLNETNGTRVTESLNLQTKTLER